MKTHNVLFWFTFLLAVVSLFLVDDVVGAFFLPLLVVYTIGWTFSFIVREKKIPGLRLLINILSLGVLGWVFYSMISYYFFYEGIVRIVVTAIVLYLGLLSFEAYPLRRLDSIQFFTLPVFVAALIFPPHYPQVVWPAVLISFYLLTLLVVVRLRFEAGFSQASLKSDWRPFLLLAIALLVSALGAKVGVEKFPASRKGLKFAFYPSLKKQSLREDRYFYLQTELVDEFTQASPDETSPRAKAIFLLSSLVKESAIVEEVATAKQGLISYANQPGLGISDSQISGMLVTLNTYLKEKTQRQLGKLGKDIAEGLQKNPFSTKEKVSILLGLNRMTHGQSKSDIEETKRRIDEAIDTSSQEEAVKEGMKKSVEEFRDWKLLEVFTRKMEELKEETWKAKIDDDLQQAMIALLKELEAMPGSSQISRIEEAQERIEHHRDARSPEAAELVSGYREVVDIYAKLMKGVEEETLPERRTPETELATLKMLESIDISAERKELFEGQEEPLKATGIYDDGSREDLTAFVDWKTDDPTIATVAEEKVMARAEGIAEVSAKYQERESNYIDIVVREPKIFSLVVFPSEPRLVMGRELKLEVRGYYTEFDYKDVTSLATWTIGDFGNLKIENAILTAIRPGRNTIYARYKDLKSRAVRVVIDPSPGFILKRVMVGLLLMIIGLIVALFVLHAKKKRRLKELLAYDPRAFIDQLYDNARVVLGAFHMPQENRPFLEYAASIDMRIGREKETFLRLTRIFTRTRYSSLDLSEEETQEAIREYNRMLKALSAKQNPLVFLLRYLAIFFRRQPFFLTI